MTEVAIRMSKQLAGRIRDAGVLNAMRRVSRAAFLESSMLARADSEAPLPIGYAQTTSSPFVIARMLEMLLDGGAPPPKVLEVGSGSGYQTALLGELGCEVVGVERIRPLADSARIRLRRLGYRNIRIVYGDGHHGWEAGAPYDGMVVCAEASFVPSGLLEQLSAEGRLVLPLRRRDSVRLVAVNKDGTVVARREFVEFVPMKQGVE